MLKFPEFYHFVLLPRVKWDACPFPVKILQVHHGILMTYDISFDAISCELLRHTSYNYKSEGNNVSSLHV
jgi:hypothetical protein